MPENERWTEAMITINGHLLTFGQSMTLRVALEGMAMELTTNGLGSDYYGRAMAAEYLACIREIRGMMGDV